MIPECRIHSGALADVPQLVILMQQYWGFEGIAPFESGQMSLLLEHLLSQPQLGTIWVARAGGDLVGYLIAVFLFSFEYQGLVAEIDELFVSPHARGRGIGTALLDVAEASLAEAGCGCIQLQLGAANSAARAFYQGRGYAARDYELLGKRLADAAVGRVD
jgi:GNAT superfamily N-acetyltransferase